MAKNYSGSDLSDEFKSFYAKEKRRLTQILKECGFTKIEMSYGFNYFSGFFTSEKTGKIFYFSTLDYRYSNYNDTYFRTAKSYTDYTGGSNQYPRGMSKEILVKFLNNLQND